MSYKMGNYLPYILKEKEQVSKIYNEDPRKGQTTKRRNTNKNNELENTNRHFIEDEIRIIYQHK